MEKTWRFIHADERPPKASDYWRTRPHEERLREVLALHHEGNELFKGGNPAFTYIIELRHVPAP